MKKFAAIWLLLAMPACAIGKLQDAAEALDQAEKELDELDISGCMDVCSDLADTCLDEANGTCIDTCEEEEDGCKLTEDNCFDTQQTSCSSLTGPAYTTCIEKARDYCYLDCGGAEGDCIQVCGEQAQDCLVGGSDEATDAPVPFADCMSNCIDEMENTLKDIDL